MHVFSRTLPPTLEEDLSTYFHGVTISAVSDEKLYVRYVSFKEREHYFISDFLLT